MLSGHFVVPTLDGPPGSRLVRDSVRVYGDGVRWIGLSSVLVASYRFLSILMPMVRKLR
ncbi:hypothetical protein M407DRAFT_246739 [Tulasnella calospora MUT 4182]|uniref:Uncharacterized protein n=1 Tax=Tulasnella calospora MUT 4182 TaxID=1051891 RepID=A0A0C3Q3Z7_9AGAM|nr:hypothetical protein M407DRAFT_246739 [Tulasnella calospora MUT 4182]